MRHRCLLHKRPTHYLPPNRLLPATRTCAASCDAPPPWASDPSPLTLVAAAGSCACHQEHAEGLEVAVTSGTVGGDLVTLQQKGVGRTRYSFPPVLCQHSPNQLPPSTRQRPRRHLARMCHLPSLPHRPPPQAPGSGYCLLEESQGGSRRAGSALRVTDTKQ